MNARPLLLSALLLLPASLCAQEDATGTDSLLFRRGQWAMQFGGGSSFFSLGLLKFTSPKSAWLLDFQVSAVLVNGTFTSGLSGTSDAQDRETSGFVRLGRRSFHRPRGKVVPFHSFAAEWGYLNSTFDLGGGNRQMINQWNAGLYFDVGGVYRLTPSFSVGGNASLSGGYLDRRIDTFSGRFKGKGPYMQGVRVLFAVGIYF